MIKDRAFYSRIGRMGGKSVHRERGRFWAQLIGKRGGAATRAKVPPDHYSRIGRVGGIARHASVQSPARPPTTDGSASMAGKEK